MRGILLDVAPPLIAYYGLRAAGVSEYVALLTATVLAGIKVSYDAIKARRLDPFAAYLMLNFGLSLAVGLATSDARMLMAGNTLVGGIGALLFLGGCFVGRPLTQIVAERVQTVPPDDAGPRETAFRHRVHVSLSAMWGIGLLIRMLISPAIIFSLSIDDRQRGEHRRFAGADRVVDGGDGGGEQAGQGRGRTPAGTNPHHRVARPTMRGWTIAGIPRHTMAPAATSNPAARINSSVARLHRQPPANRRQGPSNRS